MTVTDAENRRRVREAFTLIELLVVIGIIALLLGALIPAVNSLSKSSGRKGTVSLLLGALEQARAQAIKDNRATYVAFAAQPTGGSTAITDQTILDRYFYHSLAIFEDDPGDATKPKIQVTPWKVFPTGISLRTEISFPTASTATNATWTSLDFPFSPAGTATQKFPFLMFDESGALANPLSPNVGPVLIRLFEGYVTGTYEHPTNSANKDEVISIARSTGRATYVP